jgi:hypothetical protein
MDDSGTKSGFMKGLKKLKFKSTYFIAMVEVSITFIYLKIRFSYWL